MVFDKKNMKLGTVVGAISMLLAYVFTTLLKGVGATLTFATYDINVRQQLESGIGATPAGGLAAKILSIMGGVIPATFTDYLLVGVTGFLIVVAGGLVIDWLKIKTTPKNALWYTMTIGVVAISALIKWSSVLTLKYIPTLVGLAIYFAIVAFAVKLFSETWKVIPSDWV